MKKLGKSFFSGGTATRAEVYGLFFAAVILVGGGLGGAVAATNPDFLNRVFPSASPEAPDSPASSNSAESSSDCGTQGANGNSQVLNESCISDEGASFEPSSSPAPSASNSPPSDSSLLPSVMQSPIAVPREDKVFGAPLTPLPAKRTVIAPNVIGWTFEQVHEWTQANLRRNPSWQDTGCYGSAFPPGTVARQSPLPGTPIIDDYDPDFHTASDLGIAVWMERDSYIWTNWYSEGPCEY